MPAWALHAMHALARILTNRRGEMPAAVWIFDRLQRSRQPRRNTWPPLPGDYRVGDPNAPIAVCALTSDALLPNLARLPGVALAGRLVTPNLGIERIITNITTNTHIRYLLLCGAESPLFQPAQALRALFATGVDDRRRIIGAHGRLPVLGNTPPERIRTFLHQVHLVDHTGETQLPTIETVVRQLAERTPRPPNADPVPPTAADEPSFRRLRPGGHRKPLGLDPYGFFVITLDRGANAIVVHHYHGDARPAHEIRGRSAEGILLALLRENLISQLSHAGYLGAELTKAETALRLGLAYEQDHPLRGTPNSDDR